MHDIFYEEGSLWPFIIFTLVLGGGAAWMTGRAIALTWRPYWILVVYLLLLAAVVRFFHYALFGGTLISLHYYLVDAVVVFVIGSLSFRFNRAQMMTRQYRWLYERTGPFSWRERAPVPEG